MFSLSLFYRLNFVYLSARYNILVLIVNIVGIPTCSHHLSTWFVIRPDDGHIRTEKCSLTHNKIWCVWRKRANCSVLLDLTKKKLVYNFLISHPKYKGKRKQRIANWKTKDSAPNDSKHSLTTINCIKIIKQLISNTSYFIVCEGTCFGSYVTIIRPYYESSR